MATTFTRDLYYDPMLDSYRTAEAPNRRVQMYNNSVAVEVTKKPEKTEEMPSPVLLLI